jgi:hypothetical protein
VKESILTRFPFLLLSFAGRRETRLPCQAPARQSSATKPPPTRRSGESARAVRDVLSSSSHPSFPFPSSASPLLTILERALLPYVPASPSPNTAVVCILSVLPFFRPSSSSISFPLYGPFFLQTSFRAFSQSYLVLPSPFLSLRVGSSRSVERRERSCRIARMRPRRATRYGYNSVIETEGYGAQNETIKSSETEETRVEGWEKRTKRSSTPT